MSIIPVVKQFGLFQASGSLASIVDGNAGTGWAPIPDDLSAYTAPFLVSGLPNFAASFPGFEFDFGTPVRMSTFLFQTETTRTLARGMLLSSNNPASGVATMVQSGDVLLGIYEMEQINAGRILETRAKDLDISGRYVRYVMRTVDPNVPDTSDPNYVDPNQSVMFDIAGAMQFVVPDYDDTFTIEGWGGGASGGESATGNPGGDTTVDGYSLVAHGGGKSGITMPNTNGTPAAGGTASGGNTENTTGGDGGLPTPFSGDTGYTGAGGSAPHGGAGGAAVFNAWGGAGSIPGWRFGIAGEAPGAGGSGRSVFFPGAGGQIHKYPGGAAGGYFKHVLHRGVDGPAPGDLILGVVGAGGASVQSNGAGANGRIKFSYQLA